MIYRRMPIEIESPEQFGYENIKCNLTESSVSDMPLSRLGLDLSGLVLSYTDHLGKPALRKVVASEGQGLCAEDVLVAPGAAAALFIVATSLLNKGSHIVVAHPNYATNIETPRALGSNVDFLELTFENGFRVDLDRLKSLIRKETALVSLTTPHNPTGTALSEGELEKIIELVESKGCRLLLDETYREMNYGPVPPLAASLSSRAISVSSVSKSYGLPGVRMGWLISRDKELKETFLAAKEQIFICNSVVDEEITCHLLNNKNRFLPEILRGIEDAFKILKEWMSKQTALEWVEPTGGCVCFPGIRKDSGVDVDKFYRTLNEKYKTFVGPGHWFEMDRRHFRVGYGWPAREELKEGLENISLALDESR